MTERLNRTADVKRYKAIRQLSKGINEFFNTYGFCDDEKKHMGKNTMQYAWKSFNYEGAPKGFEHLSEGDQNLVARYGAGMLESIQDLRSRTRYVPEPHGIISRARESTDLYASSALNVAFPSMHWDAKSSLGGDISVQKKEKSWSRKELEVSLPVTWVSRVHDKGISLVRAGDGMRFILNSEERYIDRFNDDKIRVFSVLALKVKRGEATTENSWVMSYETSDDLIVSVQTNFSRCESLLRRRIKDTVMKELLN